MPTKPRSTKTLTSKISERRKHLLDKYEQELALQKDRSLQLIVFRVGNHFYAFELLKTKEVIELPKISALPHTPDYVLGVASVRGKMTLIIDWASKIGEPSLAEDAGYVVVLGYKKYQLGLKVNEVPTTRIINGSLLQSPAEILSDSTHEETYIKASTHLDGEYVFLVDLEEFIETNRLKVASELVH